MDTNEMHDMKTMINVGCEFYMQASIPSTDRVCVDIGLGVHVDYSRAEALRFIQEREAAYNGPPPRCLIH
jgi:prefoldin subunit 5